MPLPLAALGILLCAAPGALAQLPEVKTPAPAPNFQDIKTPRPPLLPKELEPTPRTSQAVSSREAMLSNMPTGQMAAQNREAQRAATPAFTQSEVIFDEPGDGRTWAMGENYKMSFGTEGATFIPFLGSDAPRNYPVRFELSSASMGSLELAALPVFGVCQSGKEVTLDRKVLREVYKLDMASVEQTFVFDTLPTRGKIELNLNVHTELEGRAVSTGLEFANDLGTVRYGQAVAIDARGSRVQLAQRLEGSRLELEVPADFVERAQLPLVVDPIITVTAVDTSAYHDTNSDIAYDASTSQYMVVFERTYSATDKDVWGVMFDSNMNQLGMVFPIDYTSSSWVAPRVANNNLLDQFFTVATRKTSDLGGDIVGRGVSAWGYFSTAQVVVRAKLLSSRFMEPDIGGDPSEIGPAYYCVVYRRTVLADGDRDIHAQLITSAGALHGSPIYLENSSGTLDYNPGISKSDGMPPSFSQAWNVAWSRYYPYLQDHDPMVAQVGWDGQIVTSARLIDTSLKSLHSSSPSSSTDETFDGTPRKWILASTWNEGFTDEGKPLYLTHVHGLTNGLVHTSETILALAGHSIDYHGIFDNQQSPQADCDGSEFVVAQHQYWNKDIGKIKYTIDQLRFTSAGLEYRYPVENNFTIHQGPPELLSPMIASVHGSGGGESRYGLSIVRLPFDYSVERDIFALIFEPEP